MTIKGKAYIAGAFEHPTRKAPDKSVAQLHAEVAMGALRDAGLTKDDVDGYFCSGDAPGTGPLRPLIEKPLGSLLATVHKVMDQLTTSIELRWIVEILDVELNDSDLDLLVAVSKHWISATQIVDLRDEVKFLPE